jgi:tetratricopeptide (TPR) repeat protein
MLVVSLLLASLLAGSAAAQLDSGNIIPRARVRLVFANGVCEASTSVALIGYGGPVAEGMTNDQCEVNFFNLPEGNYRLRVSGASFANLDSRGINLTSSGPAEFEVQVKRSNELNRDYRVPGNSFVSISDLGVPNRAHKELEKANELVGKENWGQAIQKLNKAISIYPAYAGAYNNLGVLYSLMGDQARERESLEKAISLNDHFELAYLNLGRLNIAAGDFPAAETALDKASTLDPADSIALILLAWAEFEQGRYDNAIAASHKAHVLGKVHAFGHRVAARAFEKQRNGAGAVAELELFLKEEPSGPRADAARKELETVKAALP